MTFSGYYSIRQFSSGATAERFAVAPTHRDSRSYEATADEWSVGFVMKYE